MRELEADVLQRAVDEGLITAADKERVERLVADAKKQGVRLYPAQALVRERLISCGDLLRLQDGEAARLFECPHCRHRHARADLPKKRKQRFACKGCKKPLELERAELSRLEVLASRDPLDLSIPLRASVSESSSASALSEIDLDRYEVQEELGRGGYGVVFKAVQRDLEREVALKVLRSGADLPPVSLERFVREGRAVSRLKHPNIVAVYDIGRQRDLFAMAMEYVPGAPLRNVVKERGALPWREAASIMTQVLEGIEHAHGLGIIHRDLKTNNILIEAETGRPRIIDFGLAKDLASDAVLTQQNAIVGTPNYLSPEQIEGRSSEADARADIFALGVILYELLCGKRPFEAKQKAEVYKKILLEEPRSILDMTSGVPPQAGHTTDPEGKSPVPPALAEVVHRALQKKPAERFQTATEMREALQAVLNEGDAQPGGKTDRKRRTGAHARPRASKAVPAAKAGAARSAGAPPSALLAGGVVGVLVLGLGVGLLLRGPSSPPPPRVADAPPATERPPRVDPAPLVASVTRPDLAPVEPEPVVEPEPEPVAVEPEPQRSPEPVVEPGPAVEQEPVVAPEPEPAPAPPAAEPTPEAPVALDRGEGDAREFPDLASRDQEEWVKRAFVINAFADGGPSPYMVRGLRLALSDRKELNRAFALRGLLPCHDDLLRAVGSQGLFDALVDAMDSREDFVARASHALLSRLAGDAERRTQAAWRRWWADEGEGRFREAALRGPPPAPPPAPGRQAPPSAEDMTTRTRAITTYMSQLRDRGLEVVFVIDVTLSMTDELERVKSQVGEITSFMDLLLPGKVRMGFLTYGDRVVATCPLTNKLDRFARACMELSIFNDPSDHTIEEGVEVALEAALARAKALGWRPKASRTLLFLGDAPALQPDKAKDLARQAKEAGFVLNALITKPPERYAAKAPPRPFFDELAALGGGASVEIQTPEELITRLLVMGFGASYEDDLRRFVVAYREVTAKG